MDPADSEGCQLQESGWREIKSTERTARATVCDSDGNTLALIYNTTTTLVNHKIYLPIRFDSQLTKAFLPQIGLVFGFTPL
jgi:hypothetical protein